MQAVVADTGPLNYLVLIEQIDILPALFERVLVPEAVRLELAHPEAPRPVRKWAASPPSWIAVYASVAGQDLDLPSLDFGEREAIKLARAQSADLILMDDRAAVAVARRMGFAVVGTIGLLDRGAKRGLIDPAKAFGRLRETSFRCRPELLDAILVKHKGGD